MNADCLELTVYFGERERAHGGFLADALCDIYARHELQASVVMRGVEGFGAKHQLRSDRLLTLSEDLPLVAVAVDTRPRIEAALRDVNELRFRGLVTLARTRMLTGRGASVPPALEPPEAIRLTVYVGRRERVGEKPAYEAIVDLLHRRGGAGATVLLGIDGTAHGVRRRARFLGRNAQVPLMVVSVGDGERIAGLLPELSSMLARPLIGLGRVRVCKRDGERLAEPGPVPDAGAAAAEVRQQLIVYASEQSRHRGHPLASRLVRDLRAAGAAGATSLRGIWGYHGDQRPHGDSFWQLRRRVPALTVIVDAPDRIQDWFGIFDELTDETGLVTSETVQVALRQ